MKLSKALQALLQEDLLDETYWVERAKLNFATTLEQQRRKSGLSYKDIAAKVRSSAAYISKVFRGDSNLTIESMVKLAHAAGGCLEVKVINKEAAAHSWLPALIKTTSERNLSAHVSSVSTETETADAVNDNVFVMDLFKRAA